MTDKKLLNYAIWLLSRRPYHSAELKSKIQKKAATGEEVESVLKKIHGYGYINDELYIQDFVRSQLRSKPQGLRLISQKLRQKGVPSDQISPILKKFEVTELERAMEALTKKQKTIKTAPSFQQRQKLARFLAARGFGMDTIAHALKGIVQADSQGVMPPHP